MPRLNVFVSYRRADTQDFAGRFADRLKRCPEIGEVFIDADALKTGEPFSERIAASLAKCDLCFVIVGVRWLEAAPGAKPRLFDAEDFVRREVAQALKRGCKIIPVLANQAAMPAPADLPEDIVALAGLHAFAVDHISFERDVAALLAQFDIRGTGAFDLRREVVRAAIGASCGVIAAFALAFLHKAIFKVSLATTLGSDLRSIVFVAAIVALGAAAPSLWRRLAARYRAATSR